MWTIKNKKKQKEKNLEENHSIPLCSYVHMSSLALPFPIPVSWCDMNSLLIFYPRAPYRSHRLQNADQRQKVNSGPWQWKFWSSSASSPLWRPCPDSLFARKKKRDRSFLHWRIVQVVRRDIGPTSSLLTTAAYFAPLQCASTLQD